VSTEDAFDVMDTRRSRNAADVLHIHGYPSQNALAAAARGLMFVERYGRVFPSSPEFTSVRHTGDNTPIRKKSTPSSLTAFDSADP
jgi:hypothetical protein